jgi:hypothetical protein
MNERNMDNERAHSASPANRSDRLPPQERAPVFERATPERAPPVERAPTADRVEPMSAPRERVLDRPITAPALESVSEPVAEPSAPALTSVPPELTRSLEELENTLRARFYDANLACIKEIPVRDMIKSLEEEPVVYAVVFDGIITQRLADLAEGKKAAVLLGIKLGNVFRKPTDVLLHTKQ